MFGGISAIIILFLYLFTTKTPIENLLFQYFLFPLSLGGERILSEPGAYVSLKEGQSIVIEGRLRMNSVTRKDGTKEKQTELTASRIHHISPAEGKASEKKETTISNNNDKNSSEEKPGTPENTQWDSSPLVPEVDEIPF